MLKFSSNNINIVEKHKDYIIYPTKENDNKLIISSSKNIHLQFKLKLYHIGNINIVYDDKIINIKDIFDDDIILSVNIDDNKKIEINPLMTLNSWMCMSQINYNEYDETINIEYEQIFVINLGKDIDRKEKMIKQFKNQNINNYEFIEGIDGNNEIIAKQYSMIKNNTNIVSKGHYGCLLSHIKCIELAKKRNYKGVIIMEDDIILNNNFTEILKNIKIPQSDILYLGGITKEIKLLLDGYYYHNSIMGAYSYYIQYPMYDVLLDYLQSYMECVDISYVKNIQINNNCIILNDIVKTNIIETNTSSKSISYQNIFDKINTIHKIHDKNNNIVVYDYSKAYIVDSDKCPIFYNKFIKDKYESHIYVDDIEKIPFDTEDIIIIKNFYNIKNINKLLNFKNITLIVIDFYWLNNHIVYEKEKVLNSSIFNYLRKNINICNDIKKLFYNLNEIIFVSSFSYNIYKHYFDSKNFKLLEIEKTNSQKDKNQITNQINILIIDIYEKETDQITYIKNNFKDFMNIKINYMNWSSFDKNESIHGIIYLNTFSLAYCFNLEEILKYNKLLLYNNLGSLKEQIDNNVHISVCSNENELDNLDLLKKQMIKFLCKIMD